VGSAGGDVLHADIAGVSAAHLSDAAGGCADYVDYVVWFELVGDGFETYIRYFWFFNCNYIHIIATNVLRSFNRAMANLSRNLIDGHRHDIHSTIYLSISHHQPFVKT